MKKQVIVGGNLEEAAARIADAWRRAERGDPVEPEHNITFVTWSALASRMTDKRYELLRLLHRQPAVSVSALARDLGRDFKRVHEDVKALEDIGLIEREDGLLKADYDEISRLDQARGAGGVSPSGAQITPIAARDAIYVF